MPTDTRAPEWQILDVLKQVLSELQAIRGLAEKNQALKDSYAYRATEYANARKYDEQITSYTAQCNGRVREILQPEDHQSQTE